jgi:hypothetical protein
MTNPSISEISISMKLDHKTNLLFGMTVAGAKFPFVTITQVDEESTTTMVLQDALFSSMSQSLGSGGRRGKTNEENGKYVSCSLSFVAVTQTVTTNLIRPLVSSILSEKDNKNHMLGLNKDTWILIMAHLSQADVKNLGLSAKFFLRVATNSKIRQQKTHSWTYWLQNARCGIDGHKVPTGHLYDDAQARRRFQRNDSDDEEEDTDFRKFPEDVDLLPPDENTTWRDYLFREWTDEI